MSKYVDKEVKKYALVKLYKEDYITYGIPVSYDSLADATPRLLVINVLEREYLVRANNNKVYKVHKSHVSPKSILNTSNKRYRYSLVRDLNSAYKFQCAKDNFYAGIMDTMIARFSIPKISEPVPETTVPSQDTASPSSVEDKLDLIIKLLSEVVDVWVK